MKSQPITNKLFQEEETKRTASTKFTSFLTKYATWKSVLVLLVLNVIFSGVVFPFFQGDPSNIPLDLQFSYTPEKAYQLLAIFSSEELNEYRIMELTADIIYPWVYGLFLSFIIFKLSRNTLFSLLPFFAVAADLIENSGIVMLINALPKELNSISSITSIFTSAKWILIAFSLLLILMLLIRKIFRKRTNTSQFSVETAGSIDVDS